ncbi:MAG: hypothetical protein UR30_C0005G0091 [Candidatus Peregrinibacteria bacterium GW2011_GWC2_33_13]|nr:MAG: hypothetical protein UR30_C0005G0091 [Candidatus Peregrinibacteria bacterium GW2011_GWC2_33_13]
MNITKLETKQIIFNEIQVREPLVRDLIQAERLAGSADGIKYATALISQIATFDGENLPPEELEDLSAKDFLELSKNLMEFGLDKLAKELSSSQDTEK